MAHFWPSQYCPAPVQLVLALVVVVVVDVEVEVDVETTHVYLVKSKLYPEEHTTHFNCLVS